MTQFPDAHGLHEELLNQTARELLLLQSSDWPFLVTTQQAAEYATERFQEHLSRFDELVALADSGEASQEALDMLAAFAGA